MKTQRILISVYLVLVSLALATCDGTALTSSDPNVSGVQAYATLEYVHAVQTSTAQAHYNAEWQATVQAASTQDAMKSAYVAAQSTADSAHASAVSTQTQQVWGATATASSNQATATAAANATSASWFGTATQSAWNRQSTADAASLQAQQTAQAAQADLARLADERQRSINQVQAAAPWVILAIAVPLVAYLAWNWGKTETLRRRAIPRDQRGDAPILILDNGGRRNVIDPDLFFGSVVSIPKKGRPEAPLLAAPELQAQLKARDQMVDLVNRGFPGQPNPNRQRALPEMILPQTGQKPPSVRIVNPDEVKDWLADVMPRIHRRALDEGETHDG